MKNKIKTKNKKQKIFISGTNGLTAQYGGWDQLIRNVSEKLSEEYEVICHGSFFDANTELESLFKSRVKLFKLKANGASSIIFDFRCLLDSYLNGGVCIMIGTSGGIFFPIFKFLGLKILVNPDGFEWKRSKWSFLARIFLFISDYLAINFSDLVICDHPIIQKRVKKLSNTKTVYIPYGGDNAKKNKFKNSNAPNIDNLKEFEYFFKVCRIEPENNIHIVIKAAIEANVSLVIVGNWSNSDYGKNLKNYYSSKVYNKIYLLDPIYDPYELGALRSNCISYIHGHTVGGTNPSLVEAMSLGLDIICQKNVFNQYTTNFEATYFNDLKDLVEILKHKNKKESYVSCGKKMKKIASSNFTHQIVSQSYFDSLKNSI